ncbi:type IV secretion system DNA-binding domain-containing protein [Caulobacter sp. CCH9-E1]|uniref:type IV secretion system DNA-binding domain-containing protein n=1 Tax=Caulobacter sp. CCH9-E1 TaxID=1768768 RepID=UPI00082F560B|nr:type IV secretion system DNA-binding domain-containing protein [Caulobacter sp. CCH9-E1]
MTSYHQNLSRGQALFAGSIGDILRRARGYFNTCVVSAAAGAGFGVRYFAGDTWRFALDYLLAKAVLQLPFNDNATIDRYTTAGPQTVSAYAVTASLSYRHLADQALQQMQLGAVAGLLVGIGLCILWAHLAAGWGRSATQDSARRGASIVSEKTLARKTRRRSGQDPVYLASVPIPQDLETRHVALIGSTGSGKTTALRQMLDAVEARGDTAIVYDTSGEFIAHYYRPERGDIILNPFDARGAFWSPFDEIEHPADADHIARQLIASTGTSDQDVWLEAARILVADVLRKLHAEGRTDLPTLIDTLSRVSREDLREWLADTSSARMFEQGAERATSSVLFMLSRCVQLLQYLRASPNEAKVFSFREYFSALDEKRGFRPWIFVPRQEQYFAATRPLLACFLECAATAILGLSPDPSRRVWLMLDELADLPKVENLSRLLPQGRKFGASVVLTFQAIGQMRDRYGPDGAEALLANANTKLFLQLADSATRQWASQATGTVETEVRGASENLDHQVGKGRTSLGSSRQILPLLLESEFRLPPHHGFLQLPDGYPVASVILRNNHIVRRGPPRRQGFVAIDVKQTLWGRPKPPPPPAETPLNDGGPV